MPNSAHNTDQGYRIRTAVVDKKTSDVITSRALACGVARVPEEDEPWHILHRLDESVSIRMAYGERLMEQLVAAALAEMTKGERRRVLRPFVEAAPQAPKEVAS